MRAQQQLPSRALGLASAVLGPGTLAAAPLHLSCSDEREGQLVLQWPLGIAAGSGGIPIPGNGRRSICERGSATACTALPLLKGNVSRSLEEPLDKRDSNFNKRPCFLLLKGFPSIQGEYVYGAQLLNVPNTGHAGLSSSRHGSIVCNRLPRVRGRALQVIARGQNRRLQATP
jgi:hypothetical protein